MRKEIIKTYNGDWNKISKVQNLSEDFIREFSDKLYIDLLYR